MAENQQGVSSFPLPPMQYVNLYTDDNLKTGRTPQPPQPAKDTFQMFGQTIHTDDLIIRPLESQGLRRLYPANYNHKMELKKLNQSLLVNFLDLLDILIKAPDSPKRGEKIDDLNLLFIHMHHLVNEFRPHQARETLRVMMEVQKRQRLEATEIFKKQLEKVKTLLQDVLKTLPEECSLDSKLLVKTEPMETSAGTSVSTTHGTGIVKDEPVDPRDQMMCDIVDAIN